MENTDLSGCLQQLTKVYAFAELQYINCAIGTDVKILKVFFEQRALERLEFIEDIQSFINRKGGVTTHTTLEEMYVEHKKLHGVHDLQTTLITDIDSMIIDEKALEICNCLLNHVVSPRLEIF